MVHSNLCTDWSEILRSLTPCESMAIASLLRRDHFFCSSKLFRRREAKLRRGNRNNSNLAVGTQQCCVLCVPTGNCLGTRNLTPQEIENPTKPHPGTPVAESTDYEFAKLVRDSAPQNGERATAQLD